MVAALELSNKLYPLGWQLGVALSLKPKVRVNSLSSFSVIYLPSQSSIPWTPCECPTYILLLAPKSLISLLPPASWGEFFFLLGTTYHLYGYDRYSSKCNPYPKPGENKMPSTCSCESKKNHCYYLKTGGQERMAFSISGYA